MESLIATEQQYRETLMSLWSRGAQNVLKSLELSVVQAETTFLSQSIRNVVHSLHAMNSVNPYIPGGPIEHSPLTKITPLQAMVQEQHHSLQRIRSAQHRAQLDHEAFMYRLREEAQQTRYVHDIVTSPEKSPAKLLLEEEEISRNVQSAMLMDQYEKKRQARQAAQIKEEALVQKRSASSPRHASPKTLASIELSEQHYRSNLLGEEQIEFTHITVAKLQDHVKMIELEGAEAARIKEEALDPQALRERKLLLRCVEDDEVLQRSSIQMEADAGQRQLFTTCIVGLKNLRELLKVTDVASQEESHNRKILTSEEETEWLTAIIIPALPLRRNAVDVQETLWRKNISDWESSVRSSLCTSLTSQLDHLKRLHDFDTIQQHIKDIQKEIDYCFQSEVNRREFTIQEEASAFAALFKLLDDSQEILKLSVPLSASYMKQRAVIESRQLRHWEMIQQEALIDNMEIRQKRERCEMKSEIFRMDAVVIQAFGRAKISSYSRKIKQSK